MLLVGRIVGFLVQAAERPGDVKSVPDAAGCVNHRGEDFLSSLKAEKRGGVSDLRALVTSACAHMPR